MSTWLVELISANQQLITALGSLSSLGFFFAALFTVFQWHSNERSKRKIELQRAWTEINDRYNDYLKLALCHTRLDVADFNHPDPPAILTHDEKLQQLIMFSMLTSLLERTYQYATTVFGKDHPEWISWDNWVDMWLEKKNYRMFWEKPSHPGVFAASGQYLADFESYMKQKYLKTAPSPLN